MDPNLIAAVVTIFSIGMLCFAKWRITKIKASWTKPEMEALAQQIFKARDEFNEAVKCGRKAGLRFEYHMSMSDHAIHGLSIKYCNEVKDQ